MYLPAYATVAGSRGGGARNDETVSAALLSQAFSIAAQNSLQRQNL
jgi:hypothetical protein